MARVVAGPRPQLGIPAPPGGLWKNPAFRIALLAFGLLIVLALGIDLAVRLRSGVLDVRPVPAVPEALVLGLRDRVYRDPAGRFEVTVPAAWRVLQGAPVAPNAVVFRGPLGLECNVRVTPLSHQRFDRLLEDIYAIEEQFGINMNIRARSQGDRPLVERRIRLFEQQVLAFDFIEESTGHHIQFGAPRDDFDRFEPLFRDIIETYKPLHPDGN